MIDKKIFLTHRAYNGYFRYKDKFQIYPPSKKLFGNDFNPFTPHPSIIEILEEPEEKYYSKDELRMMPPMLARYNIDRNNFVEILKILSLTTNFIHFENPKSDIQRWFIPIPNKNWDEPQYGQIVYPKIIEDWEQKNFSKPKFKKVKKIDSFKYFNNGKPKGDGFNMSIDYPDNIEYLLDIYFNLDKDIKKVLDNSINLFYQGIEIMSKSTSLSIVAFISAIENLANCDNRKNPEPKCSKCDNKKHNTSKKFKELVSKSISGDLTIINEIYNLRSRIVHNGELHIADLRDFLKNKDYSFDNKDLRNNPIILYEIEQITRICLVNWYKKKIQILK